MKINHHLDDQILTKYASGQLPEAFSLVVASHLTFCDTCRAGYESMCHVGGALLEQLDHVDVANDCFEKTLAKLDIGAQRLYPKPVSDAGDVPVPLHDYIGSRLEDVAWRPIGFGVKQSILSSDDQSRARMLYIPAGQKMPDHGHTGMEMTLVLQGAFSDEERVFARGDVEIATEELHHQPVAQQGEDCICLIATEGPLLMNGFLPKLAQKIFRF